MSRIKTIITTDVEIDDMNSLIHLCLYLNEIDLLGIIYTSSQYHFLGDGHLTLGQVTSHYRCSGNAGLERPRTVYGPDPKAKNLLSFRPFEMGWIERLWDREYREAYFYLKQHDEAFPSPEYLLSITKIGNVEFEGDVRFDTDGSNWIKDILLDPSKDTIVLQSWGGVNTIVRALLSIEVQYGKDPRWPEIRKHICSKTRIFGVRNGVGQDNSWLDNNIPNLYPDLIVMNTEFHFGTYKFNHFVQEDCKHFFKGEWMKKYIHNGTNSLMEAYRLFGDGKITAGEPEIYQFGNKTYLDFGYPDDPVYFDYLDFIGEGDSNTYIPLLNFGFRGWQNSQYGTLLGRMNHDSVYRILGDMHSGKVQQYNPYLKTLMEDWAARAQWCYCSYDEANHAPIIQLKELDLIGFPGERMTLEVQATDPDGDELEYYWEVQNLFSSYSSNRKLEIEDADQAKAYFMIPYDAKPKEWFSLVVRVKDNHRLSMTRYGQIIIHVDDKRW